jgi:uroporphyrin-III C-methyltransferase
MTVHLVGAGPGDPELITVGGLSRLRSCDTVVYDALVAPELVAEAPEHALCISREGLTQEAVNDLLVGLGRAGFETVRLKGGDPFVFGRGGEEAVALTAAGVDFEVVPGVSAAAAAPAAAGIPVTHRGVSAQVTLISGHSASGDELDYDHLARTPGTLVLFMAAAHAEEIATGLIKAGKDPATPTAVVSRATHPDQQVVVGDLGSVGAAARALPTPALIVIGEVVGLREQAQSPPWESASAVASASVGMKFAQPCLVTTIAPQALPSRPARYQSQSLT